MERVNLQEGWRFAKANSNEWTPVSVPGTVLSGLLEAGKMQDPYYRENEYEARELLAKDYVFETDFCISEEQLNKKHCVLVCEGLDTLADVYVNFADNKRSSLCRNFSSAAKALVVQWAWGSATV